MIINLTKAADKAYQKLPLNIQKKTDKQFELLLSNYHHPSLRTRKMGSTDTFEARIGIHYRFTFQIVGEEIYVLTIGPHDVGLGKK